MARATKSNFVFRVRMLLTGVMVIAVLLLVRLYFVQIVHGDEWEKQAAGQYIAPTAEAEKRGVIFFTDQFGNLKDGATTQAGWRLAIVPDSLTDPAAYDKLVALVPTLNRDDFAARAAKKGDPYEEVAKELSDEQMRAIKALDIDGLVLSPQYWRFYPHDALAAHVLGFVGFRDNQKVGRYGLERYWEDTLVRHVGNLYVNFFAEMFANARDVAEEEVETHEGDVITSIEPTVQLNLERTLDDIVEKWHPKSAGGIVMDPHTGEIVAMAAVPTFNPNDYKDVTSLSTFTNPMVERVYELGSIVKPLTVAAGIDAGAVTPQTEYFDEGCIKRSGARICNYDGRSRGRVSMQEVLNQSLNTGVTFVEERMGHDVFAQYMRNFGLGEETGIDLPGEVPGIMGALDHGTPVDFASASFGQGIAVTPIAMTRALAALGNGGKLVDPHVVKAIRYTNGVTRPVHIAEPKQVLKPETSEAITRMLTTVVDTALANGKAKQEHYSIAAKTGTAQIAIPGGGGYYEDRYLHSFFGYFPAHEPRFIIFLFTVEPQNVQYASQTLTDPFMDLTKFIINYYTLPPDR